MYFTGTNVISHHTYFGHLPFEYLLLMCTAAVATQYIPYFCKTILVKNGCYAAFTVHIFLLVVILAFKT
jgi:hypothetical protein